MKGHGYHCITFGCQMNVNDTEWLERSLLRRGWHSAALEEADAVFVNTCSVRDKPEQKVYSTLGMIARANPRAVIGVAGCVAQQMGKALAERCPQVRLVLGTDGIVNAPQAFEQLLLDEDSRLFYLDFSASYPDRDPCLDKPDGFILPDLRSLDHETKPTDSQAFVNIMQGCDNFCAYCIVPYTRGRCKSRPADAVVRECGQWIERGIRDITLLGQNVNAYGKDRTSDGTSFAALVRRVAALEGLERLHVVSPHPRDFDEESIALFGELDVLAPRLHLPLQSGSDAVLKAMGRGYTMERFRALTRALTSARPDMVFSTDLIVGFPGETETDFLHTLDAVRQIPFAASFSFCYSDRPGTRASRMADKIPAEIASERLQRLQTLQDELSAAYLKTRVGQESRVLVESKSKKQPDAEAGTVLQGHDQFGSTVNFVADKPVSAGDIVPVVITDAKKHSLFGIMKSSA
ncbi:MAG: tRNA (N6-isopentenyl adenosine(37)-C2)-methylthiotransferase MiaB [Mailhella sp.]|nr:tRNA (N6-isopentenyl adenosine(37)-C2)-methylthiotransferase MiaB [Mailhella sp.]